MGGAALNETPTHVGLIMDGNRRWARSHKLEIARGHLAGAEAIENVIEECGKIGIKHLSIFSFSAENWKREPKEVETLLALFLQKIAEKTEKLTAMGARVKFVGRITDFPVELQASMHHLEKVTAKNTSIVVNFAVSYGGKTEIVDACRAIKKAGKTGEEITETEIEKHLYEAGQPDLDLVIRTGGQSRLSGFMMWQTTYAELYFTDTLWPDFDGVELKKALDWYVRVKRNFGQ